jgi:teichuronic acid biosynthesis glycosyltransferase TuaH
MSRAGLTTMTNARCRTVFASFHSGMRHSLYAQSPVKSLVALPQSARHLVWMAGVSWDGNPGPDRLMASAMTDHANILWVDPPVSPLTSARHRFRAARALRPVITAVSDRVIRLTPVALPGLSRPLVRLTTAPLVRAQVRWALHRTGIRPTAVVATHLEEVLGGWGDAVINVLWGTDDYVAGAELMGLSARRLRILERRALARADVVGAISLQLAERWAALGAKPVLIPNGCHLARAGIDKPPPGVRDLPAPVVGLIGQLNDRINLDLLSGIADAGFSLLVVGPRDPRWEPRRFAGLIARPYVHYTGPVPMEAVPSYLAAIDVGIAPYKDSPFNRASFPLKTLEYLGAGRPAVSTDLPAARWLRDDLACSDRGAFANQILALAGGSEEFIAALRGMVGDPSTAASASREPGLTGLEPPTADHCRAFAARHSWSRRAEAFAAAIGFPVTSFENTGPVLLGRHP